MPVRSRTNSMAAAAASRASTPCEASAQNPGWPQQVPGHAGVGRHGQRHDAGVDRVPGVGAVAVHPGLRAAGGDQQQQAPKAMPSPRYSTWMPAGRARTLTNAPAHDRGGVADAHVHVARLARSGRFRRKRRVAARLGPGGPPPPCHPRSGPAIARARPAGTGWPGRAREWGIQAASPGHSRCAGSAGPPKCRLRPQAVGTGNGFRG
jgi:hypothetical protein